MIRIIAATLFCLLLLGCGSDGQQKDTDAGLLTCQAGELAYQGTMDGQTVEGRIGLAGHALTNVCEDSLCSLRVYFEGGGRLEFEWEDTLPNDTPRSAAGSLNLEVHDGPNVGNCSSDPVSEITLESDGLHFVLRELSDAPYCSGTAVSGQLEGCAKYAQ